MDVTRETKEEVLDNESPDGEQINSSELAKETSEICLKRWFKPVQATSFRVSILGLLSSSIGGGTLLPSLRRSYSSLCLQVVWIGSRTFNVACRILCYIVELLHDNKVKP
jgi:hypothetical protein